MKYIWILIVASISLSGGIMPEAKALDLFVSIKKKEYNWVLQEWRKEMKIKTASRVSLRRSVWSNSSVDKRTNEPITRSLNKESADIIVPPEDPVTVPDI